MLKISLALLFLAVGVILANKHHHGGEPSGSKYNRHSELLKPETNAIDHGPNHHKTGLRLGHRGEHWGLSQKRKLKKKNHHSLNAHHDSLDDIRLQDLSYGSLRKSEHLGKKKANKDHKKGYLKKLKLWKAKMMSKKQQQHKKKSSKKNDSKSTTP